MPRPLILMMLCICISTLAISQSKIDELKNALNDQHGRDKLLVLHELTEHHIRDGDAKRATKYAKQAQYLAETIINNNNDLISQADLKLKPLTYLWLGKAQYQKKDYYDAKKSFQTAFEQASLLHARDVTYEANLFLTKLDSIVDRKSDGFVSALRGLNVGEMISSSAADINLAASLKLASAYENKENYPKAIEQYEKAIDLLRDKGDSDQIIEIKMKVASLYEKSGLLDEALNGYKELKGIVSESNQNIGVEDGADSSINTLKDLLTNTERRPEISPKKNTQFYGPSIEAGVLESQNLEKLARDFEKQKDFQKSLSYYKLYLETNRKMEEEEHLRELELLEIANQMENQTNQITLLKQEKELQDLKLAQNQTELAKQTRFRNNLILGSLVMLSFVLALYSLYKKKNRAHQDLKIAYEDLHITQKKLSKAERSIKTLLQQQVSGPVADALLSGHKDERISKRFVCVMFLDIRNFTPYAEDRDPEEIIQYQNDLFGFMITIIQKNHGIVNQFLGDGFMATFGAPISHGNECDNAYNSALQILETLKIKNESGEIPVTKVGIGLHAGPVVTGNVGTKNRKQYSITGNTVILASRIEQLNKKYGTQLLYSDEVSKKLSNPLEISDQYADEIVKGRSTPIRIYIHDCDSIDVVQSLDLTSEDQIDQIL